MSIHLMELRELTGHDVYELVYAHAYGESLSFEEQRAAFWRADNRYLSDDGDGRGMDALAPALGAVYPAFNWFGPNRVARDQWRRVEVLHLAAHPEDASFFLAVRRWLEEGNRGAEQFWLMGP